MSLANKDIYKALVTKGNLGFAAAGQPLFTSIGGGHPNKRRVIYNVRPAQLVAYTIVNGVTETQDETTIAASDLPYLYVGVGVDLDGDGITDDVRHLGIEQLGGCNIKDYSVSSPRCGGPAVSDFYFDCTQCDETYSVMVRIDDNRTRSYSPFMGSFMDFVGTIVTQCFTCDSCPVEHNCKEVACKLADALNGELNFRVGNSAYPDWKGQGLPRPFFATRLHETSKIYCFAPEAVDACETCTHVDAIAGIRVRGVIYPLTATVDPANTGKTLIGQLNSIVDQINEIFISAYGGSSATGVNPHAGSAYATGTYQQCCSIQLHVNACDANFELLDENQTVIVPTTENNPFTLYAGIEVANNCIGCDDVALAARGVLTGTTIANGDTVTIDGKVYTFEDTLTNVDGHVKVGASDSASLDNLVDAINLGAGAGTAYATATTLHPTVSATAGAGDTVVIEAKTAGVAGNSIGTTDALTAGGFAAATLLGGADAAAAAASNYTCGIRVIAEQIKGGCGCFLNQPLNFYGRKLKIEPIGEGWRGKPWKVVEVQAMELPAGFGSMVQWLEYKTEPEGRGRRYSRSNINQGWANLPDVKSRVRNAVTADCADNYCQYFIRNLVEKKNPLDKYEWIEVNSNLFIPVGDTVTSAQWELFATALLDLSPQCRVPSTASCDTSFGGCS